MARVRCEKGHIYDNNRFYSCPHCSVDVDIESIINQTYDNLLQRAGEYIGVITNDTVNSSQSSQSSAQHNAPDNKHVSLDDMDVKAIGAYLYGKLEPVVAWIVCMNEDMCGQDFRITKGTNTVGNDESYDIVLPDLSDDKREVAIIYSLENNNFFLETNVSSVYVNGEEVQNSVELDEMCVIDIEKYNLIFLGFCEFARMWNEV